MKAIFKHLRLLPAVVVVGVGLLAIKGVDIARAAQGAVEDLDNAGLAPSDVGGTARPDYANGEDPSDSASEVDVLTSLTHRRGELDARERGLAMRENLLNASEGRVNQKIAALQALQTQIQGLLKQRDTAQQDQINSLIKAYGPDGMKPASAAAIFNSMPDEVLVPIAKGMKPADLGPILSKMNPDAAQRLTIKLAALLKLPETATTAACPVTTAATTPAADSTADATPPGNPPVTLDTPPQQTAAATPPPAVAPTPTPAPAAPAATPPTPAPAKPAAATPAPAKPETTAAAAPPKPPHHVPPHHVAHAAPPPKPENPPVTLDKPAPSQAATAIPPKPAAAAPSTTTPAPTQAAVTPPKPSATTPAPSQAATAIPPKPSATTPAPIQAAAAAPPATTPAATPGTAPASTAPTPLTH